MHGVHVIKAGSVFRSDPIAAAAENCQLNRQFARDIMATMFVQL